MHVSYTTHIASLHYIENFSTYVVSRRSRSTKKQGRFRERSTEVMELSINTASSKGHGQTSFPAKCIQLHVLIWYCSACCACDGHVLRACCPRVVHQNRFKPVQTGSNRFKLSYASCMSLFGIVLHAVYVMFTCYARAVHVL